MPAWDDFVEAEMRERAATLLKRTALFQRVSNRLLIDLVEKTGVLRIRSTRPLPGQAAVLAVLDGTLRIEGPPPTIARPVVLQTGTHLAYEFTWSTEWHQLKMSPDTAGTDAWIFYLTGQDFDGLPRVIVNALDPNELDQLNAVVV